VSYRSISTIAACCLLAAWNAQAGTQLFQGSWVVKAFGNERTGGTEESAVYSAFGIPQGIQCNPIQPRCPFESTPTDGAGNFAPQGGSRMMGLFCAPWANWRGLGTTARPAKGQTPTTGGKLKRPIPPLYRNPAFFTTGGAPNVTECTATSTGATPGGKGRVQAGMPITGKALATTWVLCPYCTAPRTGAAPKRDPVAAVASPVAPPEDTMSAAARTKRTSRSVAEPSSGSCAKNRLARRSGPAVTFGKNETNVAWSNQPRAGRRGPEPGTRSARMARTAGAVTGPTIPAHPRGRRHRGDGTAAHMYASLAARRYLGSMRQVFAHIASLRASLPLVVLE